MEILLQLGANETVFIQFALFVVTITVLTVFVYNPFFKAYDQRLKLTKGADQVANETQDEAKNLEQIYKAKAREINDKLNGIFEHSKKQGFEQSTKNLDDAKASASKIIENARNEINTLKINAEKMSGLISEEVASEIAKKITGAKI